MLTLRGRSGAASRPRTTSAGSSDSPSGWRVPALRCPRTSRRTDAMPTTAETIAAIAKITGEPPEAAAFRLTAVADDTPWSVDHVAFMELARLHAWKESDVTLEQWL